MAITFMDGFDLYGDITGVQEQWGTNGSPGLSTTAGRFGGGAITATSTGAMIHYTSATNVDFVTVGFAVKTDLSSNSRVFMWSDTVGSGNDADMNAALLLNTDGSMTLEGDSGIDRGTSSSGVIAADTWYFIECQVHRASSGNMEVFVNGTSILSVASDYIESANASSFGFGLIESSGDVVIDDIYIAQDASALDAILGDSRIETLLPNNDTSQSDWTPSVAGSPENAFDFINDALGTNGDGDSTYVSETTLNNKSEFEMEDLANTPTAIHAVAINTRASKTDAGVIAYTQYIDSNGTESNGTEVPPGEGTYALKTDIFETDPDTASAWTESGVNAAKLGIEITG